MVDLVTAGLVLVLAGMGVMVLAALSQSRKEGTEVRGGGVVLIGPIPIIFGSDAKWATIAIVLAIALLILLFIFSWV